jgi:lysophospholipase L1-like esterase
MKILRLMIGIAIPALLAAAPPPEHWVGTYGNPPIGYEPAIRDALGAPLKDQTVRQIVRVAAAGTKLRVRLTNELGTTPLRIGAASIVQLDGAAVPVPGTKRALLFAGAPGVVIPAGAPMLADALSMIVKPGVDYAVSIYFPETSMPPAHAQMADVAPGDQTARAVLTGQVRKRVPAIVARIDIVSSQASRALVAFGDSITEGAASTPSANMSWPDQLSRLLAAKREGACWSIVNAGISGNRLLHDGRGPNALARFDRDVLSVPGVRTVILLEGINDIGASAMSDHRDDAVGADRIIASYRQFAARARAHGIRVIAGTLLPFEGAAYFTAEGEAKRQAANAWIRTSNELDGVIDFDAAMRDPAQPTHMTPRAGSADSLHPQDPGYTIMAQAAAAVIARDTCPQR